MSAKNKITRTTINRTTIDRARDEAANRQRRADALQASINAAAARNAQQINELRSQNRAGESRLARMIGGFRSSLKSSEEARNRQFSAQNRKFENKLSRHSRQVQSQLLENSKQQRKDLKDTRLKLERQLNSAIGDERRQRQNEIKRIDNELVNLDESLRKEIHNVDVSIRADMQNQREFLSKRMDGLVGREREERVAEINRLDNNIRILDTAINQIDEKIDSEISRVEQQFSEMLNIEAKERQVAINNLHEWTKGSLEVQREEYLDIAKRHAEEISINRKSISELLSRIDDNTNDARDFIEDLRTLMYETYEDSKADFVKFAPNGLPKVERNLQSAIRELERGAEQVAKAQAISTYEKWLELREEIQEKKREFEFWLQAAKSDTISLLELLKKSKEDGHHMHYFEDVDVDGEFQQVYSDAKLIADEWSGGKFSELEARVERKQEQLSSAENLTLQEVKQIHSEIGVLQQDESDLIVDVEEKFIASRMREDLGFLTIDALEESGYFLVENGFKHEDEKNEYLVQLSNKQEDEVIISFIPGVENNENTLDIQIRNDLDYGEDMMHEMMSDLRSTLEESGITVGSFKCGERVYDEFYNMEEVFGAKQESSSTSSMSESKIERGGSK